MVEVFDCAQLLGLQVALELDKAYCRDYWQRGRIRVRLFNAEKMPIREDIPNRKLFILSVSSQLLLLVLFELQTSRC